MIHERLQSENYIAGRFNSKAHAAATRVQTASPRGAEVLDVHGRTEQPGAAELGFFLDFGPSFLAKKQARQ